MKIALLISTYNWPEALNLVLKSAFRQSVLPDEILIADDGSTEQTRLLITTFEENSNIKISHVWQKDEGFRKSAILNKAIDSTNADYIIEVDGDCILHKHFVKDHISLAAKNTFLYGSRVSIKKQFVSTILKLQKIDYSFFSKFIQKRTRALHIPLFAQLFITKPEFSKKLRGCNLSFYREDFLAVNGYNEDFIGWGKEDSELAIRMINNGSFGRRIRYKGIVFHIWHPERSKSNLSKNKAIQASVLDEKKVFCENGIKKNFT